MTDGGESARPRPGRRTVAEAFVAVLVLTSLELLAAVSEMDRAACITTLAGLLMTKVAIVILLFMRARDARPAPRLVMAAIALAAVAAVVLMLETAFRVRVS